MRKIKFIGISVAVWALALSVNGCWVKHKLRTVYVPQVVREEVILDGTVISYVHCEDCCDNPDLAVLEIPDLPPKTVVYVNGERMPRDVEQFTVAAGPAAITAVRPGYVLQNTLGLTGLELTCEETLRVNLVFDYTALPPAPN